MWSPDDTRVVSELDPGPTGCNTETARLHLEQMTQLLGPCVGQTNAFACFGSITADPATRSEVELPSANGASSRHRIERYSPRLEVSATAQFGRIRRTASYRPHTRYEEGGPSQAISNSQSPPRPRYPILKTIWPPMSEATVITRTPIRSSAIQRKLAWASCRCDQRIAKSATKMATAAYWRSM